MPSPQPHAVRVTAPTPVEMALAFEQVMLYARAEGHQHNFTFGPFNKKKLAEQGMLISGDIDGVLHVLSDVPNLTIRDA